MKQRDLSLDIIRIVSCVLVVFTHSQSGDAGLSGPVLFSVSAVTTPAVCLFFMVSGALLLPVSESYSIFIKRRLYKILMPLLFCTVLELVYKCLVCDGNTVWSITKALLSTPFSVQANGIFWFLYVLIGLYLLAPVLSPWIMSASKRESQFYISLWTFSLCLPWIALVLDVNRDVTSPFYYFSGYVGYFLLGSFLVKFNIVLDVKAGLTCVVLPLLVMACLKLMGFDGSFSDLMWYLSPFGLSMSVGVWSLLRSWAEDMKDVLHRYRKWIISLSNMTLAIYLLHIHIVHDLIWGFLRVVNIKGLLHLGVSFILGISLTIITVYMLSYLPVMHFFIGYRHSKS